MGILDRWRSIAGVALLLEGATVNALDWGGRVDYVRTHLGDLQEAHVVTDLLLNPSPWLFWPTLIGGLSLIWWDARRTASPARRGGQRSTSLNPYLVVAAISATVCAGALIGYFINRQSGPIHWNFNDTPLGWSATRGGPIIIDAFQIKGENISDTAIEPLDAYIRSDMSLVPISLSALRSGTPIALDKVFFAPGLSFILSQTLSSSDQGRPQGMLLDQFREK